MIIDHSFRPSPTVSISINELHKISSEIELKYGKSFQFQLIRIQNLRGTYPEITIFLMDDDIVGAFRHVKYNLFVAGAFSFIANDSVIIPTAQTFGSTASPSNYESLAQARNFLSTIFSSPFYSELLVKHKDYLDMVHFDESEDTEPTRIAATCIPDSINPGVLSQERIPVNTEHHSYVEKNFLERQPWLEDGCVKAMID